MCKNVILKVDCRTNYCEFIHLNFDPFPSYFWISNQCARLLLFLKSTVKPIIPWSETCKLDLGEFWPVVIVYLEFSTYFRFFGILNQCVKQLFWKLTLKPVFTLVKVAKLIWLGLDPFLSLFPHISHFFEFWTNVQDSFFESLL